MAKITVEFVRELVESLDYPEVTYEQLAEMINEKASEPGWLSLNESIPKLGVSVLGVDIKNGYQEVIDIQEIEGKLCICTSNGYTLFSDHVITHWMPLPNKPVNSQPK